MKIDTYLQLLSDTEKKHSPEKLFFAGDENLLFDKRRVSVVGSRTASKEGLLRAKIVVKALVQHDIIIVSGLAKGIDTMAHQRAIALGGKTIAVLGTPLNKVYPRENAPLLEVIKKGHLAISQFPEGYPSQPKNFPIRNRTMALISDATIIIEATEKSGTRHQGWEALRLGREVFILENVVNDPKVQWAKEMMDYGAQILLRDNVDEVFENIPYLTSKFEDAF
ncbi:DNA-processing protein DprA [Yeosuana marina]|uniref:DNA-processing protein DprA n=1 Tax=Yeosuana marina TaxID=1565536 RepID=UPI0030C8D118